MKSRCFEARSFNAKIFYCVSPWYPKIFTRNFKAKPELNFWCFWLRFSRERDGEFLIEELFSIELFQIAALKPLLRVELFVSGDIKEQEVFYLESLHNKTDICL